MDVEGLSR